MNLTARLRCPVCRAETDEVMPVDACVQVHDCASCGTRLRPKPGDCCVFCSYADTPCPPKQADGRTATADCAKLQLQMTQILAADCPEQDRLKP